MGMMNDGFMGITMMIFCVLCNDDVAGLIKDDDSMGLINDELK